jgi:hypothetical protein
MRCRQCCPAPRELLLLAVQAPCTASYTCCCTPRARQVIWPVSGTQQMHACIPRHAVLAQLAACSSQCAAARTSCEAAPSASSGWVTLAHPRHGAALVQLSKLAPRAPLSSQTRCCTLPAQQRLPVSTPPPPASPPHHTAHHTRNTDLPAALPPQALDPRRQAGTWRAGRSAAQHAHPRAPLPRHLPLRLA